MKAITARIRHRPAPLRRRAPKMLTLESGDKMTRDEFMRRYETHPEIKKAELIDGIVYIPDSPCPHLLQTGDHMDRDEFMRRYEQCPEIKKAELIDGVVFVMASPVRVNQHAGPDGSVQAWAHVYASATPGVRHATNATIYLGEGAVQPDATLFIDKQNGGSAAVNEEGYLDGPPEFVAEISASTKSLDMHKKLEKYRSARVQEFFDWQTEERAWSWFQLVNGAYVPLAADKNGIVRSRILPGLWLDTKALLKFDSAKVLRVLQRGLKSAEHMAFVRALRRRAKASA